MMFAHSPDGVPLSIVYDDLLYYYVTNLQGDVVALLDASGNQVVTYTYDAWGNVLTIGGSKATTLGRDNPLRYRGYVYDTETGLYYLQSRYYDPEIGRFINADSQLLTGSMTGMNLFAYCLNNPTNYYDDSGMAPQVIMDKVIHDMVLADICARNSDLSWTGTCIYYNRINAWGGWGFCDLYNKKTGEVWELKKASNSRSCRTDVALLQLYGYVQGRLKWKLALPLKFPNTTQIPGGAISFMAEGYVYNVTYWSEGNGILRYKYDRVKTDERKAFEKMAVKVAETTVIAGITVAVAVVATAVLPSALPLFAIA